MALSYKARRRLSLLILIVGLPIYIMVAITILNLLGRPHILIEILVYIVLGVAWIFPFKSVFKGIGQADPDKQTEDK
jgi:predicted membrane protein